MGWAVGRLNIWAAAAPGAWDGFALLEQLGGGEVLADRVVCGVGAAMGVEPPPDVGRRHRPGQPGPAGARVNTVDAGLVDHGLPAVHTRVTPSVPDLGGESGVGTQKRPGVDDTDVSGGQSAVDLVDECGVRGDEHDPVGADDSAGLGGGDGLGDQGLLGGGDHAEGLVGDGDVDRVAEASLVPGLQDLSGHTSDPGHSSRTGAREAASLPSSR